jgi:hypothetical protein
MNASHHDVFTKNAIQLYCQYVGEETGKRLAENAKWISRLSEKEDTAPWVQRGLNWHFFRSNDDIDMPGVVKKTSEFRLKKLVKRFFRQLNEEISLLGCYDTVGRILHHIQDMSCPAHVVPVYHADYILERKPDSMEKEFDRFIKSINIEYDRQMVNDVCVDREPYDIYKDAASITLRLIDSGFIEGTDSNGQKNALPFKKFWMPYDELDSAVKHKGFSTYGEYKNTFGKSEVGPNKYIVTDSEYMKFYEKIYRSAVLDSVKALHYFECKLTGVAFGPVPDSP